MRPRPRTPFQIVHEDADLIVVNKPPGVLTSSGPRDRRPTLINTLRDIHSKLPAPVGLIHRLDRDAAGLIVFSKNPPAFHALKKQFGDRTAGRSYHAVVDAVVHPDSGKIESRLLELADGRVVPTRHGRKGDPAVTHFRVLERGPARTLLELALETGRKHQIRVHLASRGWPIVGDSVYNANAQPGENLMLIASKLELEHPRTRRRVRWQIDLPPAFGAALRRS